LVDHIDREIDRTTTTQSRSLATDAGFSRSIDELVNCSQRSLPQPCWRSKSGQRPEVCMAVFSCIL